MKLLHTSVEPEQAPFCLQLLAGTTRLGSAASVRPSQSSSRPLQISLPVGEHAYSQPSGSVALVTLLHSPAYSPQSSPGCGLPSSTTRSRSSSRPLHCVSATVPAVSMAPVGVHTYSQPSGSVALPSRFTKPGAHWNTLPTV